MSVNSWCSATVDGSFASSALWKQERSAGAAAATGSTDTLSPSVATLRLVPRVPAGPVPHGGCEIGSAGRDSIANRHIRW